jgi:hypothetical protein
MQQFGEMIFFSKEAEENFSKLDDLEKGIAFTILAEHVADMERKLQNEFLEKIDRQRLNDIEKT